MSRLVGLLQLARKWEHNHIWAINISNIVLEDESWTPSGLLAVSSFKLHHVDFANLRGSVFILHGHGATSFHQRVLTFDDSIARAQDNVKLILLFTQKNFLRCYDGVVNVVFLACAIAADDVKHSAKWRPVHINNHAFDSLEPDGVLAIF